MTRLYKLGRVSLPRSGHIATSNSVITTLVRLLQFNCDIGRGTIAFAMQLIPFRRVVTDPYSILAAPNPLPGETKKISGNAPENLYNPLKNLHIPSGCV